MSGNKENQGTVRYTVGTTAQSYSIKDAIPLASLIQPGSISLIQFHLLQFSVFNELFQWLQVGNKKIQRKNI